MICDPETNKRTSSSAGFTIIETMLVLAIAAVILLIIFLALPGLERSSRNNQRRQDIQAVLQFVSHYELNNSGDMPTTAQFLASNTPLSLYPSGSVAIQSFSDAAGSSAHANVLDPNAIAVYNYQKCTNTGDRTNAAAGYTDIVALYAVESNSGAVAQSQQL